jgi:hypothetical protein
LGADDGEEQKTPGKEAHQKEFQPRESDAFDCSIVVGAVYRRLRLGSTTETAEAKIAELGAFNMNGKRDRQNDNDRGEGRHRTGRRDSDRSGSLIERKENPQDVTDWDRPPRRDKERDKDDKGV